MNSLRHLDIRVTGHVQGVGFRYHARLKAYELGIYGRVRNEADGSVHIEAEGTEDDLRDFIAWCWHGPVRARVDSVRFAEGKMRNFMTFESVRGGAAAT